MPFTAPWIAIYISWIGMLASLIKSIHAVRQAGASRRHRIATESATAHWKTVATFKGDFQAMSVKTFFEMTFYSALAWEKLGRKARAQTLFRELLAYAGKLKTPPAPIDCFATSLPTLLLFEDDLTGRRTTFGLFLESQARLGLRQRKRAQQGLREVLRRDPNHALARDLNAAADLLAKERKK